MSLQYIIDGYNIINHRLFPRNNKKPAQGPAALIYLIKSGKLCGSLKNEAVIVFDGYPADISISQLADSRLRVVFSGDSSADDKIKRIAEGLKDKKNTIVVSDDKEISLFIKLCGIKSMSVEDFIGKPSAVIKAEEAKQELNYSQIAKINAELKKIWLE